MLAAATAIAGFVGGATARVFAADDMARSAVLFKLIVIGEAASKISLKAVVENGRLVIDEPTELPEGTELVRTVLASMAEGDSAEHPFFRCR